ncbi:NINE protein [Spirosoma sordidisoli]|uniref:TM2 domain-containing protein n=1 Tax=Spirosoma sordidisoli TaxID=2502893 RepID=A0A4Q2UG69_9BACT|nr:TM2 domain-containing protein [Spirosoma sordidisoli]RYC68353.1 TM2 domain-containing protein [Spirosoma sordidisoli]
MKKLLVFCLLTVATLTTRAADLSVDAYLVDDQQVEQLFAQSEDVSLATVSTNLLQSQQLTADLTGAARVKAGGKEFVPALLLNFFLGGLGIHRFYLGTETLTWVGYILTCGGIFGIVPLVDFVVLIVNHDNLSPYIDNPKFFMWAKN